MSDLKTDSAGQTLAAWFGEIRSLLREGGWRAVFDTLLDRDGNFHEMYWSAYQDGMRLPEDEVKHLLLMLAMDIKQYQPQKNRRLCQLRGYSDALKQRWIRMGQSPNAKLRDGAPETPPLK